MSFAFQAAGYAEIPALLRLCREAASAPGSHWDETYPDAEILRWDIDRGTLYQILREDGTVIGMVSIGDLELQDLPWPDDPAHSAEAARFCLHPKFQGKGLGRAVFRAVLTLCRDLGYRSLRYLVAEDDLRLRRMYESCGAVPLERQHLWGSDYRMYLTHLELPEQE